MSDRAPEFWTPQFLYNHRDDGTILMQQAEPLPAYLPTVADYFDKWADATPDRTWLARRKEGRDWQHLSYSRARQEALAIGEGLLALGLGPMRPLLILSENSLEHGLLSLACTYVGIPYAPISPAYPLVSKDHAKLKDIAKRLKPGAVFADRGDAFAPALQTIAAEGLHVITCTGGGSDAIPFDSLKVHPPDAALAARRALGPETVVKFLHTSGSTGTPKAVIITNDMICSNQAMVRDCYRFLEARPPVVLDWAPWNHTAAGNKASYLVLTNGGTYYIDDGRPVPGKFDETLRNLAEISCTWYFNVPLGFDMLVEALEQDDELAQTFFSDLDMLFYAGAGLAQHTWDRLAQVGKRVRGHEILLATGLGATETAPFALACTEIQPRPGNIGMPSRGMVLKLVPEGDKLEARLKGPNITPGYYRDPAKTAEAFDEEGFYKLGDALRPADPEDFARGFIFDGRLAENFKLNTGTWVPVGAVRAGLVDTMGGLIRDAVIVGENQGELGALLILSDRAKAMGADEIVEALTDKLGEAARAATGSATRVRRAVVLETLPSFDRGETTDKGSLNQRALRANNEALIAMLYAGGPGVIRA